MQIASDKQNIKKTEIDELQTILDLYLCKRIYEANFSF